MNEFVYNSIIMKEGSMICVFLLWNNSSKEEKKSGNKLKLANYLWMYQVQCNIC